METSTVSTGKSAKVSAPAISLDDTIALFQAMVPSRDVEMRREMEKMFPSIICAIEREVCPEQIIATLRRKWPDAHVASIVKMLDAERARRLEQGEPIHCKPFGSPRKPTMRRATKTADTSSSAQTSSTAPDSTNSDQPGVSA